MMRAATLTVTACLFATAAFSVTQAYGACEFVRLRDVGGGFVLAESGRAFVPWGFNYDHDADGRLLEDYWEEHWAEVESAFREMKALGATVTRIHLQF
ncbi:MAG: hypothetical protein KDA89_22060, partial [Planctomycetaceae bacterium]|nr:hypothetical protein [Planctomycetaceae bacterium]